MTISFKYLQKLPILSSIPITLKVHAVISHQQQIYTSRSRLFVLLQLFSHTMDNKS